MMNDREKVILFLSNSKDVTCDYFESFALSANSKYVRLNTDFSPDNVSVSFSDKRNVTITVNDFLLTKDRIQCIWNRRPEKIYAGNYGDTAFDEHYRDEWRHAIDALLKQIDEKLWINYPTHNSLALSKIEQIVRANKFGLFTPETILTQERCDVLELVKKYKSGIIVKPVSHGYICKNECVHNIYTCGVDIESCDFDSLKNCPTLFQEKIAKECDIRINYIDGMFESVKLIYRENNFQRLDIRRDNMKDVAYEQIDIPKSVQQKLSRLLKSYKLRFAAIDMCISLSGEWIFFEINPNGQWAWLDILGVSNFSEKLLHGMLNSDRIE